MPASSEASPSPEARPEATVAEARALGAPAAPADHPASLRPQPHEPGAGPGARRASGDGAAPRAHPASERLHRGRPGAARAAGNGREALPIDGTIVVAVDRGRRCARRCVARRTRGLSRRGARRATARRSAHQPPRREPERRRAETSSTNASARLLEEYATRAARSRRRAVVGVRRDPSPRPPATRRGRVEIVDCAPDGRVVVALVQAQWDELTARYGTPEPEPTSITNPSAFVAPTGAFVAARLANEVVGCGGICRYDDTIAELKAMYVVPAQRGRGYGRLIVQALEARAAALGYRVVRLETGDAQPEAIAVYTSLGYAPIEPFRDCDPRSTLLRARDRVRNALATSCDGTAAWASSSRSRRAPRRRPRSRCSRPRRAAPTALSSSDSGAGAGVGAIAPLRLPYCQAASKRRFSKAGQSSGSATAPRERGRDGTFAPSPPARRCGSRSDGTPCACPWAAIVASSRSVPRPGPPVSTADLRPRRPHFGLARRAVSADEKEVTDDRAFPGRHDRRRRADRPRPRRSRDAPSRRARSADRARSPASSPPTARRCISAPPRSSSTPASGRDEISDIAAGTDLIHPDDFEALAGGFGVSLERPKEPIPVRYRTQHVDGSWRIIEGTYTNLLDDPDIAGIVLDVDDVTERANAEAALRAGEARNRRVIDSLAEGIILSDARRADRRVQPGRGPVARAERATSSCGRTHRGPAPGTRSHRDGTPIPPEDRPANKTRATGQPCRDVVMGVHRSNGELTWVSANSVVIDFDDDGRPGARRGVAHRHHRRWSTAAPRSSRTNDASAP